MLGRIGGRRRRGWQDEMAEWHHWLNGHGFGWTPGVGDGQRFMGLQRVRHDWATDLIWSDPLLVTEALIEGYVPLGSKETQHWWPNAQINIFHNMLQLWQLLNSLPALPNNLQITYLKAYILQFPLKTIITIWSSSYITVTIHVYGMTKKKINQANGSRFFDKEIKFTLNSLLTEPWSFLTLLIFFYLFFFIEG